MLTEIGSDQQLTVAGTAVGLTVPTPTTGRGANYVVIKCNTAQVRWSVAATPTATEGMTLEAGDILKYSGNIASLRFIRTSGTSAVLDIQYFIADTDTEGFSVIPGSAAITELPAGTNNIGDVDVLTMPAAATTTDSISVAHMIGVLKNNLTSMTPAYNVITASASGNTSVAASAASATHYVVAAFVSAASAVNIKLQSNTTDIMGLYYSPAQGAFVLPFNPAGWCKTASGETLNINLSAAVPTGGVIVTTPAV